MIYPIHILPDFPVDVWSNPNMDLQSGFDRYENGCVLEIRVAAPGRLAFPLKAHFPDQDYCVQFSDRNDVIPEQKRARGTNPNVHQDANMALAQFSMLYDHDVARETFLYQITRFLSEHASAFSGKAPDRIQTLYCTKHFVCVNAPYTLPEHKRQAFGIHRLQSLVSRGFNVHTDKVLAVAPIGLQGVSAHAKLAQLDALANEREMLCALATGLAGEQIHTGVF